MTRPRFSDEGKLLAVLVAMLLLCMVLVLSACARARRPTLPVPPLEQTCAPDAHPASPDDVCTHNNAPTWTASGYVCARCVATTGGCVSLADAAYCVRGGDCADPYCGGAP